MRLVPTIALAAGVAALSAYPLQPRHESTDHPQQPPSVPPPPSRPGQHMHHIGPPKAHLDEEAVLRSHQPDPLSYWAYDSHLHVSDPRTGAFEPDQGQDRLEPRYGHWLKAHVVMMILAWFVNFPLAGMFKIAKHPFSIIASGLFSILLTLALAFGKVYSSVTPDLYMGSKHASLGWWVSILGIAFGVKEAGMLVWLLGISPWFRSRFMKRGYEWLPMSPRPAGEHDRSFTILPEVDEDCPSTAHSGASWRRGHKAEPSTNDVPPSSSIYAVERQNSDQSGASSDDTLHHHGNIAHDPSARLTNGNTRTKPWVASLMTATSPDQHAAKCRDRRQASCFPGVAYAGRKLVTVVERSLILAAFAGVMTGIVEYSGACRAAFVNGCLAHIIKGGIFFWYGLLTWARYVGAFAENGWAWNKKPDFGPVWMPSAEFVESLVIFLYGCTNTWMERWGVNVGDPYTAKQIQHISIAVMFWFAGLGGMLLDSKAVRSLLVAPLTSGHQSARPHPPSSGIRDPPSYSFSFNPFPALTIGVTGIAMASHAQEYQFQVTVHTLWGVLLAGFAVMRMATYTFLFLRPPTTSILPSRPPTEALASVCLTSGGIVFILSMEQVTLSAMRHGYDDIMVFLNVTIAIVCFLFAWILVLFSIKGWATGRMARIVTLWSHEEDDERQQQYTHDTPAMLER